MSEDAEAPNTNMGISQGEGIASKLGFEIKQGQSLDMSQLRANNRTARAMIEITTQTQEQAATMANIFTSGNASTEEWCSLTFSLSYALNSAGEQEEMELRTGSKFPDEIVVMEPSGSQKTAVNIPFASFVVDSREAKKKYKRKTGEQLPTPFPSSIYLELLAQEDCYLKLELKFATNVTSRQHDAKNFYWKLDFACDLGGENGTGEATTQTTDFEYVARQLKSTAPKAKKKPRTKKSQDWEVTLSQKETAEPHAQQS